MKKSISIVLLTLMATSAPAATCPDLTGLYQMAEGAVIKYENEACDRLIRWTGFTTKKGEIVISPEKQEFTLDNTPLCNKDKCQSAYATAEAIVISLNYDGTVKVKGHGLCNQRGSKLSLDQEHNLQVAYEVTDCDDGFTGSATKTFSRIP